MRLPVLPVGIVFLFGALCLGAAEPKPFPGKPSEWSGFERHDFPAVGTTATVVVPKKALPGNPWVWRGEFFGAFADADKLLVENGWHLAYISAPNLFGSPKAIAVWEKFHALMVGEHGMHPKPGFIGLSRGGLYCMNWAAVHPEKTLAVYLDNAVCDFKSWPGGKPKKLGTGNGAPGEWLNVLKAFDFADDAAAIAYRLNPVDNLAPLAKAGIPLLLVYGDKDQTVPHTENSEVVYNRYTALKAPVTRIVMPGVDHHPHGLKDNAPVLKFFAEALEKQTK